MTTAKRDFRMLWAGQSLNLLGDQFLVIALPLLAVQVIGASASQAVLLPFALFIPFLLFGLPAGAIVDRLPRRLTMIVCDSIQAVIFTIVAALTFSGTLTFPILMLLVSIAGTAVVFFQIAYTSYIPELFSEARDLQRSNSRLFFSESMTKTLGPMAAGPVIAWLGASVAIAVNAATFIISVLSLLAIKHRHPTRISPVKKQERGWIYRDIREGLHFVFRHQRLEPVIMCGVVYVMFSVMIESSLVLYCLNVLGLNTITIGFVVGAAAAGFPLGNLICTKPVRRFGVARTLVVSAAVSVSGLILIPIAGSLGSVPGLIAANILHGFGEGVFGPTALTLRQTDTPDHLLGRINSVQRFLMWGVIPIGNLIAALTIKLFGLSGVLWVGGFGTVFCLPLLMRRGILNELLNPRTSVLAQSRSKT
ncbi:MFS transporter [Nostoc sp. CENA67]|uniref:MFS transporter n=1 Tax=Amazonocrinis nigriterrae CENA67 TaxID=2794033 RepID=A0A8J7L5Y2_9NOST|nr:MFS transporter [Amazonocrinis nigriterrae]MBH8560708.1 MFS transporter [Amazonocrinis nigriterrae CENA67]